MTTETKPSKCKECSFFIERGCDIGYCDHIGASRQEIYWFDWKTQANESINGNSHPPDWCPLPTS